MSYNTDPQPDASSTPSVKANAGEASSASEPDSPQHCLGKEHSAPRSTSMPTRYDSVTLEMELQQEDFLESEALVGSANWLGEEITWGWLEDQLDGPEHREPTSPGDYNAPTGVEDTSMVDREFELAMGRAPNVFAEESDSFLELDSNPFVAQGRPSTDGARPGELSLNFCPQRAIELEELMGMELDHQLGFLLSLVDGRSSLADLLEISGLPRQRALPLFLELFRIGAIKDRSG